jgi:hypothetical protein
LPAAFVAGLSGFAFGLVAASLWLFILTPLQSATLIVAFGLLVQGYSVWKLWHALDWRKLWPLVIGAARNFITRTESVTLTVKMVAVFV